jgi:hypothetical protein
VGANSDFDIALAKDSEVKPLIAMPLVTAAFDAATRRRAGQADERERRAQERRVASEGEGGRGKEPDRVDAKSAIKSWIRDNVADADAEVLDVDSPRAEGRYWVVRARVRGKNAFGGPVIDAKDFYLQVDKDASWGVRLYEVKFAR